MTDFLPALPSVPPIANVLPDSPIDEFTLISRAVDRKDRESLRGRGRVPPRFTLKRSVDRAAAKNDGETGRIDRYRVYGTITDVIVCESTKEEKLLAKR